LGFVSSVLLGVEAIRACGRFSRMAEKDAREWLEGVSLLPIDDSVLDLAVSLKPWKLRALDALHLATALTIKNEIGSFFTYDDRLAEAAADHGFAVLRPGSPV
jgi:predicted nucleic acid-binding protein